MGEIHPGADNADQQGQQQGDRELVVERRRQRLKRIGVGLGAAALTAAGLIAAQLLADRGSPNNADEDTRDSDTGSPRPDTTGQGRRVQCGDGSYSNSGGRQGACSYRGGVAA